MRKVKLQMQVSIDGFVAGPNGEMDWMVWDWDDELKDYVTQLTEPTDTILLGRVLAQGFIPHWASDPQQEGADKINSSKKVVFTKTLEESVWDNTILAKGDFEAEVMQIKKQDGNDIIVYGGGRFVSSMIKKGLIDEYYFLINPTILGKGMPIFQALEELRNLKLVETKAFKCGIAVMRYQKVAD